MKTRTALVLFTILISVGCSKKETNIEPDIKKVNGTVEIDYTLKWIDKPASNQLAIWIEDMNGNYIQTVFATSFAANGGYLVRPDALPLWISKSNWKNASKDEVDAVSGATQRVDGEKSVIWNCKDTIGSPVKQGYYKYVIEGNVFWGSRVIYTGLIKLGTENVQSTATAEYINTTAASADSLIKNVRAVFTVKP